MRGADEQPGAMFSYVSLEQRVPQDHPLRAIRRITDQALERLSPRFGAMYVHFGRPSILPERLLRALLLQALYTIRSASCRMSTSPSMVRCSRRGPVTRVSSGATSRHRMIRATRASIFGASAAPTRPISRRRIQMPGCTRKGWGDRRTWRTGVTWCWKIAPAWLSRRASRPPMAMANGMRPR
jgi:hypothetical protein